LRRTLVRWWDWAAGNKNDKIMDLLFTGITDTWTENLSSIFHKWNNLCDKKFARKSFGADLEQVTVDFTSTYYSGIIDLPVLKTRFYKKEKMLILAISIPAEQVEQNSESENEALLYELFLDNFKRVDFSRRTKDFDAQGFVNFVQKFFKRHVFRDNSSR
jgi:hypothetical protein